MDPSARAAQDLHALGNLLVAMLLPPGDTYRAGGPRVVSNAAGQLPQGLAALQPLVSRLIGTRGRAGFAAGAEVIVELLGLKERFPFSPRDARAEVRYGMLA
jgi:hypothetical protein